MVLRIVATLVIAVACAVPAQPRLTVSSLLKQSDDYVGQRVAVVGRLHAQVRLPDDTAHQPPAEPQRATLHLRDLETPIGPTGSLDLYRATTTGAYEPLSCVVEISGRCGKYEPGSEISISGIWVKHVVPAGQVVHPGQQGQVIAWRTLHFLVVSE